MMASYWGFLDNYGPTTRTGNKRQHQMPLHAGGGMSPVLNQHDGVHGVGGGINRLNHRGSGPAMHQSMYKGTATGLATGNLQASMGGSILLDPHHQPPPGAFSRRPPMFHHPHTHTTASVVEEDEEQEPSSEMFGGSGGGSGGAKKYRSALGESFMSARVSTTISGDGDEEQTEPEGAGVLGLLYQFQKVQDTAGGRGGVNI